MDLCSAIEASNSWITVLRECGSKYPSNVWYVHVQAIESKMFIHAGKPVGSTTPDHKLNRNDTYTHTHTHTHTTCTHFSCSKEKCSSKLA